MTAPFLPLLWSSLVLLQNPLPLLVPGDLSPGDTAEVYLWVPGTPVPAGEVVLERPEGKRITAAPLVDLPGSWEAPGVRMALLGLGPDVLPGPARVILRRDGRADSVLGTFSIVPRTFRETSLRVTPAMRSIQTDPDPRRQEQSIRLTQALEHVDRRALMAVGLFFPPVKAPFRPTSQYGDRRKEIYPNGRSSLTIHWGTDMAAPVGTPVFAPASGRAVLVEDRILTGWTLVLEHAPGVYSLMYHLDAVNAVPGRLYRAGDPVGTVGSTGFSTGPHLHWEVRVNTASVDPLKLLKVPLIDKERIISILHRAFLQKRG